MRNNQNKNKNNDNINTTTTTTTMSKIFSQSYLLFIGKKKGFSGTNTSFPLNLTDLDFVKKRITDY